MKKLILLILIALSFNVYSDEYNKTYMQFKAEFLNMPIKDNHALNYKTQEQIENNALLLSFIVTTVSFTSSFLVNKYCIPNDQLSKKNAVTTVAATISVSFGLNYLRKSSERYKKKKK